MRPGLHGSDCRGLDIPQMTTQSNRQANLTRRTRAAVLAAAVSIGWAGGAWAQSGPATSSSQPAPPFYADKGNVLTFMNAAGVLQPVRTQEQWQTRRAHILQAMQQVMGPLPPASAKVPPDVKVLSERTGDGVIRRKITFATEKGDRVPAWLILPAERKDPRARLPGAVCLHQTIAIGKDEPAGLGRRTNLAYGLELARRGYVAICPDYPNYGEYKFDAYAAGYASATMKGIWNHMRAVDVLEAMAEVDAGRIGCIGHSLGGHNTLFLAVFDERIKAAVTSCGFTSFPKYYGGKLAGWSHAGYMPRIAGVYGCDPKKMPFDFTEVLAAIAPRAVFVNAPLRDSNFEVSGVRDCLAAARPVYALFGAADKLTAVHPDSAHEFPPAARQAAYQFLDTALQQKP